MMELAFVPALGLPPLGLPPLPLLPRPALLPWGNYEGWGELVNFDLLRITSNQIALKSSYQEFMGVLLGS